VNWHKYTYIRNKLHGVCAPSSQFQLNPTTKLNIWERSCLCAFGNSWVQTSASRKYNSNHVCRGFPQSLQEYDGMVQQISHDTFLPHPFLFIIYQLSYRSNLYNLNDLIQYLVSRWLPTAAARVRARVWQVGFVVDKVSLGQVFSEYFGFLGQSAFHQILHHHNHPGQVQLASIGRRAAWTQYGLHPPLCQ
jgi:hypothetical protein